MALDEEAQLPACLESVRFCDEIVVVDSGSKDRTAEVARAGGARVVPRAFDDFARQHEFLRLEARGDWVLSIDADERCSPELAAAARRIADAPAQPAGPVAYSMPFKNHFRGVWLRHGGFWPDRHVRLFRREQARYDLDRPVHEKLILSGPVSKLDAPMLHYTWRSLSHCLAKTDRYAESAAQALHAAGRRATAADVFARPLWRLLRAYLFRGGFLDGTAGAAMAWARAYEAYARYARLWELSNFTGSGKDGLP